MNIDYLLTATLAYILVAYIAVGLCIATWDNLRYRRTDTFLVFSLMILLWVFWPVAWLYKKRLARKELAKYQEEVRKRQKTREDEKKKQH